jgi:hypothetical protein
MMRVCACADRAPEIQIEAITARVVRIRTALERCDPGAIDAATTTGSFVLVGSRVQGSSAPRVSALIAK